MAPKRKAANAKYEYWLTPDGLTTIAGWARRGLTDAELAAKIGVSRNTLLIWAGKFPSLKEALRESKDEADMQIEDALYRKALKGDTTAMIFWLKNRKPDEWRDRHERNTKEDKEEQRARIEKMKAETKKIKGETDNLAPPDDGFIKAINQSAKEDWDETEE